VAGSPEGLQGVVAVSVHIRGSESPAIAVENGM